MAFLVLEDGSFYKGMSAGIEKRVTGEVVFNTSMTGYQEILTDPSYYGQIVVMTYPLIGNYGVNSEDVQSKQPQVSGFVMRELCEYPSNWLKSGTLANYLQKNKIPAVSGVDTRSIVRKLRDNGTMNGMLTPQMPTAEEIAELAGWTMHDHVQRVTTEKVYGLPGDGFHVAVLDFGIKQNIIESLRRLGCMVTVFPADTGAERLLSHNPDGIMLSNGPGDPKDNVEAIANIRDLLGKKPVFGICLGHQLLALAAGADTEKLRFGHRGGNHPVKDLTSDRVYITSQNHGYAVIEETLAATSFAVTHRNLNDMTVEGIEDKALQAFSVQFHPEACPGPQENHYLFQRFIDNMEVDAHAKR